MNTQTSDSQAHHSVEDFMTALRARFGERVKPATWIRLNPKARFEMQDLATRLIAQFGFTRGVEVFVERFEAGAWYKCYAPEGVVLTRKEKCSAAVQAAIARKEATAEARNEALLFLQKRCVIDATGITTAKIVRSVGGTIDVLATAEAMGFTRAAESALEEQDARWAAGELNAQPLR